MVKLELMPKPTWLQISKFLRFHCPSTYRGFLQHSQVRWEKCDSENSWKKIPRNTKNVPDPLSHSSYFLWIWIFVADMGSFYFDPDFPYVSGSLKATQAFKVFMALKLWHMEIFGCFITIHHISGLVKEKGRDRLLLSFI